MTYPNAANALRKAYTVAAIRQLPAPSGGNRRERRAALAKVRRAMTNMGVLDAFNETLTGGRTLHPTRGYRTINPKRIAASTIVEMAKKGFGGELSDQREAIKEAA